MIVRLLRRVHRLFSPEVVIVNNIHFTCGATGVADLQDAIVSGVIEAQRRGRL